MRILLFFITLMANTLAAQDFDWQGHRGARGLAPENTLPAFRKALDLGVKTLELDVVVSADGQVVVSHEAWMNPEICTQPSGERIGALEAKRFNLYKMAYAEIKQFDCGQKKHPRFPEQVSEPAYKPLLREVIEAADAYAQEKGRPLPFYNIEIKSEAKLEGLFQPDIALFCRLVYAIVKQTGITTRSTLQSFDVRVLQTLHKMDKSLTLAMLEEKPYRFSWNLFKLGFRPAIYSPYYRWVTARLVQKIHRKGMKIVPWTVNNPEDMQRLRKLGVDGIITDYPNRALGSEK